MVLHGRVGRFRCYGPAMKYFVIRSEAGGVASIVLGPPISVAKKVGPVLGGCKEIRSQRLTDFDGWVEWSINDCLDSISDISPSTANAFR
jgi:hypothetical protein